MADRFFWNFLEELPEQEAAFHPDLFRRIFKPSAIKLIILSSTKNLARQSRNQKIHLNHEKHESSRKKANTVLTQADRIHVCSLVPQFSPPYSPLQQSQQQKSTLPR